MTKKLEWTTKYGVTKATVGKLGTLSVAYQDDGSYSVSVFGQRLTQRSLSLEDGKLLAVSVARKLLNEAVEML